MVTDPALLRTPEYLLFHSDCFEAIKLLDDINVKVDAVIADPPYGITACKWDKKIPFPRMWEALNNVVRDDNSPILIFGHQPFTSELVHSNIKNYKWMWYYKKRIASNFASAKYQPMRHIEEIAVFTRKGKRATFYPIRQPRAESGKKRLKTPYFATNNNNETMGNIQKNQNEVVYDKEMKYPENIQEFNNRARGAQGLHPTQKPIELMEYLIKSHTQEGDTVLDFTMGSGTTGVACMNLKRRFIGMETEKKYYDIAVERIKGAHVV